MKQKNARSKSQCKMPYKKKAQKEKRKKFTPYIKASHPRGAPTLNRQL